MVFKLDEWFWAGPLFQVKAKTGYSEQQEHSAIGHWPSAVDNEKHQQHEYYADSYTDAQHNEACNKQYGIKYNMCVKLRINYEPRCSII